MKRVFCVILVLVAAVLVSSYTFAQEQPNAVNWKQSWKNFIADSQGISPEEFNTDATVFQMLEFVGNARSENFLSVVLLSNFNKESRVRLGGAWVPSGASTPLVENEILLEPFEVKVLQTDVPGRIQGTNGWAFFWNQTPDEYFGVSVVVLCLDPSFPGISIMQARTLLL